MSSPEPENEVRQSIALLKADRPRWGVSDELIRLWEMEFGHLPPGELQEAALAFLRRSKGAPSLAAIRESIDKNRAERRAQSVYGVEDIEPDPEPVGIGAVPADLERKFPWYRPDATSQENLAACQAYRDARGAPPVFSPTRRQWTTGPR